MRDCIGGGSTTVPVRCAVGRYLFGHGINKLRLEFMVSTRMSAEMTVCWDVTPCNMLDKYLVNVQAGRQYISYMLHGVTVNRTTDLPEKLINNL
jgi:hypothetical protein